MLPSTRVPAALKTERPTPFFDTARMRAPSSLLFDGHRRNRAAPHLASLFPLSPPSADSRTKPQSRSSVRRNTSPFLSLLRCMQEDRTEQSDEPLLHSHVSIDPLHPSSEAGMRDSLAALTAPISSSLLKSAHPLQVPEDPCTPSLARWMKKLRPRCLRAPIMRAFLSAIGRLKHPQTPPKRRGCRGTAEIHSGRHKNQT